MAAGWALWTFGCAETVEFDQAASGPVIASTDPNVVAELCEGADNLVSDGDRLYWTATGPDFAVRSCRKDNCAGSVITYEASGVSGARWLAVADGEPYVLHVNDLWLPASLLAYPSQGGPAPARVVAEQVDSFALLGDSVLFASSEASPPGIYRVPRAGGGTELVLPIAAKVIRLVATDERLFWLTRERKVQTASLPGGTVQTLASYPLYDLGGLDPGGILQAEHPVSLSRDATAVYFGPAVLASIIQRCALSGCETGAELVTSMARRPSSLFVSDEHIYLLVELASSELGLQRCTARDCSERTLLGSTMDFGISTIAGDEAFIYAFSHQGYPAETEFLPADHAFTTSGIPTVSLRRYSK